MAVFKPIILNKDESVNEMMTKLYRFSQELKYTLSNLSLDDNIGHAVLDVLDQRNEKTRTINFNANGFLAELKNFDTGMYTSLEQSRKRISLLVQSGSVVDAMLTRMEVYGEGISLKTGQVIIQAENMTLDKGGNTFFSGNIIGGSINIVNRFKVYPGGECYIDGTLTTETLNPPAGVYADELEVFNDNGVINTVTGTMLCGDAYISETLTCRRASQRSDQTCKKNIKPISARSAAGALKTILPARYVFKDSGREGIGCMAQTIYRSQDPELPMTARHGKYLELPYSNYGVIYASVIQQNQKRIDLLKKEVQEVKRKKEGSHVGI